MPEFTVNHAYTARRDGSQFGPWLPGDVVSLDAEDADWVSRDSPGCLLPLPTEEGAPERQKLAGPNRQHRGGANR